ncbi:MAG: helix-hairpin-helix domain-containing protein, partial [Oscillospiraceae bacterium]
VIEYNNENNTKIILKDGEKSLEKRKKSVSSQSSKINKSSTKSSSKTSSTKNISSSKTSSKPDKSDNKNDDKKEFTGIININTATAEELCLLENIGESRAKAIIDFRNKCGGFTDIEEIKAVYGIGDKIFLKIKDKIKI